MAALAICAFPQVIVLDSSLAGTEDLDQSIRALYPSRFARFGRIQWMSSKTGLRDMDVDRILRAIGMRSVPTLTREERFSRLRILVVDTQHSTLAREVQVAAPGAKIKRATSWEAIDRLGEGDLDLVVAANAEDISLPTLVRFVRRCEHPPLLAIASASRAANA